jgi:PTS system ascorbate-specific IIB component
MAEKGVLKVLAVCGVGMGSSLMKLGVKAEVTHTDFASMRGMKADLIVGQPMHTDEVPKSAAKAIVSITNLVDVDAAVKRITPALKKLGYIK